MTGPTTAAAGEIVTYSFEVVAPVGASDLDVDELRISPGAGMQLQTFSKADGFGCVDLVCTGALPGVDTPAGAWESCSNGGNHSGRPGNLDRRPRR